MEDFELELSGSYVIGDTLSDIRLTHAIGCNNGMPCKGTITLGTRSVRGLSRELHRPLADLMTNILPGDVDANPTQIARSTRSW